MNVEENDCVTSSKWSRRPVLFERGMPFVADLLRAGFACRCLVSGKSCVTTLMKMADDFSKAFAMLAVLLVFCPVPTTSTASPGLLSKNYAQIAQLFGFSFPKLPNISFANTCQCRQAVQRLLWRSWALLHLLILVSIFWCIFCTSTKLF